MLVAEGPDVMFSKTRVMASRRACPRLVCGYAKSRESGRQILKNFKALCPANLASGLHPFGICLGTSRMKLKLAAGETAQASLRGLEPCHGVC